jgi:phosphoglycerate kinase
MIPREACPQGASKRYKRNGHIHIAVIDNLLGKADRRLIGGGMANTFLRAQGKEVGPSLVENDKLDMAKDLLKKGANKIVVPVDVVIADQVDAHALRSTVAVDVVPSSWRILDIGLQTGWTI